MTVNKIFLSISFLFFTSVLLCQSRGMRKAVRKGKNYNNTYNASFNKPVDRSDIKEWCNNNEYVFLSCQEGEIARFGGVQKGIVGATFMSREDHSALVSRQIATAKARERSRQNSFDTEDAIGVALGVGLIYSISKLFSNTKSSFGSMGNSSAPSEIRYKNTGLIKCPAHSENHYVDSYDIYCEGTYRSTPMFHCQKGNFWVASGYYENFNYGIFLSQDLEEAINKICE